MTPYFFTTSVLLFTAVALQVRSVHTYSNDVMAIRQAGHNEVSAMRKLAGESIGELTPSSPLLQDTSLDTATTPASSFQPSDIPSLQPSVVGKGSVNQMEFKLTHESKQAMREEGGGRSMNETTTKVNQSFGGTKRCGECKINIDSININKAKIDLRRTRDTFLVAYEAGLEQKHCSTTFDGSLKCTDEFKSQQLALREYKQHTNRILRSLETFDCIISLNQQGQQSCPVEVFEQRTSNATTDTNQDFDLDSLDALAAEEITFEETRELTRVVRSTQATVDAIDELMKSLGKFGGASAGPASTIATSTAKSEFLGTKVQLLTDLNGVQYILTERVANNEEASKFLLRLNYIVSKAALGNISSVYREVIELKKEMKVRLSKLSCPFGKFGLMSKVQRQGCDGVDQNCDGRVDECAEDQVPPTIRLAQPMPTTPFKDINSARDFLESHITVVDDCAAEIETDIVFLDGPLCSSCKFSVRASDRRCDAVFQATGIYHDSAYSEQVFAMPVLSNKKSALSIKCGFFQSTEKNFDKYVFSDSCKDNMAPLVQDAAGLQLDQTILKRKVDIGFWYDIDASKKDGLIDVDIVVKSNELEGEPNDNTMASMAVRSPTSKGNAQAMIFLAPTTCQDGFSQSSSCVAEKTKGVTTRIYDIKITATGADGATDTGTCSVIVVPQNHHFPIKDVLADEGIAAGETVANDASSSGKGGKKSSKHKSGERKKKRRAVRHRGLQEEQVNGLQLTLTDTLQDEDDFWYPPTNTPAITPTLEPASMGSDTLESTTSSTNSPPVEPAIVQKFEDEKDVLYKQYKLSKWRFEVGSVSLKFDPRFGTGIKNAQEEKRRRLQNLEAYTLLEYKPLC